MEFDPKYVDTWRHGHLVGTRESMQWCMKLAMSLAERAKTDDGIRALLYLVKKIDEEERRRYPSPTESGSSPSDMSSPSPSA